MRHLKEKLLLVTAIALYHVSQVLFLAAQKEHVKHCPRHQNNSKKAGASAPVHFVN